METQNSLIKTDSPQSSQKLQHVERPTVKKVTTIAQAIREGTQIRKYVEYHGIDVATAGICEMIMKAARFFNLVETISPSQGVDLAELIIEEYPELTVEDISMMMRGAKMQDDGYEKIFSRMDGRLIMSWIKTYINKKKEQLDKDYEEVKKDYHNAAYETMANIADKVPALMKLLQKTKEPEQKIERPSFEKEVRSIRENMYSFTMNELKGLLLRYNAHNLFGVYKELITQIEAEILSRMEDKPSINKKSSL